MNLRSRLTRRLPKTVPLQVLSSTQWAHQRPTYHDAQPAIIDAALDRAQRHPSGNWYVFAASADIGSERPFGTQVAGMQIVAWRDEHGALHVGPAACPHLGADLTTGTVDRGKLICPWHGLKFTGGQKYGWAPLPVFDDGILLWVRLDHYGQEEPRDVPVIPLRPSGTQIASVTRLVGVCEPVDIIANRLDPWHGAWFHPYSFSQLEVLSSPSVDSNDGDEEDRFLVAVTFRMGRLGVPVVAEFTAPEPRTVVMRIVDGEGAGSVVETHATPLGSGSDGRPRTAMTEVVIAQSDRSGFRYAHWLAPVVTRLMRAASTRLWRDDLAYAERRYHVRTDNER